MLREEHFTRTFQQKGWTKTEIEHALEILKRAEAKKSPFHQFLEKNLYWFGLAKGLLANTTAVIITFPLLLYFYGSLFYLITALVALTFGVAFHTIMKETGSLTIKNYLTTWIIMLPVLFLQFNTLLQITKPFASTLQVSLPYNPFLLALTYAIPYLAPYTLLILEEQKWI